MFPSLLLHYVGGTFSSKYYAVRRAHFALKGCVIPATALVVSLPTPPAGFKQPLGDKFVLSSAEYRVVVA